MAPLTSIAGAHGLRRRPLRARSEAASLKSDASVVPAAVDEEGYVQSEEIVFSTSQCAKTFIYEAPKVGDVLLWESWLRHEVPPNMSEEERISVSFNYKWE